MALVVVAGYASIAVLRSFLFLGDSISYVVLPTPVAVFGSNAADVLSSLVFLAGVLALLVAYRQADDREDASAAWLLGVNLGKSKGELLVLGLRLVLASVAFDVAARILYLLSDFSYGAAPVFGLLGDFALLIGLAVGVHAIKKLSGHPGAKLGAFFAAAAALIAVAFALDAVAGFANLLWLQNNFIQVPGSVSADAALGGVFALILMLAALIAALAFQRPDVQRRDSFLFFAFATFSLGYLVGAVGSVLALGLGFWYEYSGWEVIALWLGLVNRLLIVVAAGTMSFSFFLNNRARLVDVTPQ